MVALHVFVETRPQYGTGENLFIGVFDNAEAIEAAKTVFDSNNKKHRIEYHETDCALNVAVRSL